MGLSTESIKASLQNTYGTEFVTADIRAWCAMNDVSYQTVAKKLKEFDLNSFSENIKNLKIDDLKNINYN